MPMRRAGASCSAGRWRATSAGERPLVCTPLFTSGSPAWRRRKAFGRLFRSERFGLERLRVPLAQLREQRGIVTAADRPAAVEQVEPRLLPHGVLLGGRKRAQGADVAPVAVFLEF